MSENISLSAYDRVKIARDAGRPKIDDYINALFDGFVELKGDRVSGEDESILGGIGWYHGIAVTVIGHRKGKSLEENVKYNFGMPQPSGYRKALRLMEQAEKFHRPIITFVDTPGAYPGIEAEENGQSIAIAESLAKMSALKVPIITVITGEGNSGGALAIAVANSVIMLENSVYSILSPEGFASILWKDAARSGEACEIMKMTAENLKEYGLIDEVIKEPEGGIKVSDTRYFRDVDETIYRHLKKYSSMSGTNVAKARFNRFRKFDYK